MVDTEHSTPIYKIPPLDTPGDSAVRHALVGTQFYNMPGRVQFYGMPGRGAVLRHALAGSQFCDMPKLGRSFTTCTGARRSFTTCMVGMQFYDMP